MVDRMGEIRLAQEALRKELGGVVVGMDMEEPVSSFWSDLVGQYSWTVESKSTTGLVSATPLSIHAIAERMTELADSVRRLRRQRQGRLLSSEPIDLKGLLSEASRLHSEALHRLKNIAKSNRELTRDDWGVRSCRENLHGRFVRILQSSVCEFETAVDEFREDEREEAKRHLRQVGIEDEKKIDDIITQGATQQVVVQAMSGDVSDALAAIQGRHQSIAQLERDVVQLRDLFIDIEALVELQQKSIDSIENHIHKAKDYVVDGDKALNKGQAHQSTNRKLMCCILIIVIVGLAAIVSAVILKTQP